MGVTLSDTENTLVTSLLLRRQFISEELRREQAKIDDALGKVIADIRIRAELPEGRYQLMQQEGGNFSLVEAPSDLGMVPKEG